MGSVRHILGILAILQLHIGFSQSDRIAGITVRGNKRINRYTIIAQSGLQIGDRLTNSKLTDARANLHRAGLYGARTDDPVDGVRISSEVLEDGTHLVIEVDENDVVREIKLTGTGPIPLPAVRRTVKTHIGMVLHLPTLETDITSIRSLYEDKGYQAFVEDLGIRDGI